MFIKKNSHEQESKERAKAAGHFLGGGSVRFRTVGMFVYGRPTPLFRLYAASKHAFRAG